MQLHLSVANAATWSQIQIHLVLTSLYSERSIFTHLSSYHSSGSYYPLRIGHRYSSHTNVPSHVLPAERCSNLILRHVWPKENPTCRLICWEREGLGLLSLAIRNKHGMYGPLVYSTHALLLCAVVGIDELWKLSCVIVFIAESRLSSTATSYWVVLDRALASLCIFVLASLFVHYAPLI